MAIPNILVVNIGGNQSCLQNLPSITEENSTLSEEASSAMEVQTESLNKIFH